MPKTIQVRDVPDNLYCMVKARAAQEGMSLSGFIKHELEHTMARPSLREWLDLVGLSRGHRARKRIFD